MYYTIKKDSEVYNEMMEIYKNNDNWYDPEINKMLENFINMPPTNMYMAYTGLALKKPIPGREKEFRKPDKRGIVWAKKNSDAEKEWFNIVQKYNLKYQSPHRAFDGKVSFQQQFDTPGKTVGSMSSSWTLQKINDVIVLEAKGKELNNELDFLEVLEEAEYHQMMADYHKNKKVS